MRRREARQMLRLVKFYGALNRWSYREPSQTKSIEMLGMRERSFWRGPTHNDEAGAAALSDGHLGKTSAKQVPVDEAPHDDLRTDDFAA